jgi:hypothetical protein
MQRDKYKRYLLCRLRNSAFYPHTLCVTYDTHKQRLFPQNTTKLLVFVMETQCFLEYRN